MAVAFLTETTDQRDQAGQEAGSEVREAVQNFCEQWKKVARQNGRYQGESRQAYQSQWEGLGRAQALNKAAGWLKPANTWRDLAKQVGDLLMSIQIIVTDEREEFRLAGEGNAVRVISVGKGDSSEQAYKACGCVKGYAHVEQDLRKLLQQCLTAQQDEDTNCLQDIPA